MVKPGDGEEVVHSPIGVNATLHCAVNNTNIAWSINAMTYDDESEPALWSHLGPSKGLNKVQVHVNRRSKI